MLLKMKPLTGFAILMGLMVGLVFPPLLLAYAIVAIVWAVRKTREHTDPQSRAWREAQRWHQPNG